MNLRVTDGTTTMNLDGGTAGISGCTYFPVPGTRGAQSVIETADLVSKGTAPATVRAAVNTLERLIEQAARVQAGQDEAPVYVEYRPVATDTYWRARLLDGRVVWSDEPGVRRIKDTAPPLKFAFILEREPDWEGAEVEAPLSADGQAASIGGRTLTNGAANWAQIAASAVAGVLPARTRLRIQNTAGAARTWERIYIALNARSDPANFTHILEGESGAGGANVSDATCSGGLKKRITANPMSTVTWSLSQTLLQDTQGRRCMLLVRLAGMSGMVTVTPQMRDGARLVKQYDSVTVSGGEGLWNLGVVELPPGGYLPSAGSMALAFVCTATAGSATIDFDFVQLTPLDGLRVLEFADAANGAVANNAALVDDGIGRVTYIETGGVARAVASPRQGPLLLWPGVTQRLYILAQSTTGMVVADTVSVRVWVRPRRRVI